ncbi:transposase, partial [Streptomyces sp. NPDC048142]|uniref:transposase n=1 Tax=Streptomyces sp. NPDC048142 TaxID=3365501 RepID=UPI003719BFD7
RRQPPDSHTQHPWATQPYEWLDQPAQEGRAAWLELSLAAIDLLAWTRVLLLDGELATAEPKKLRYRLLHVAARITRGGRRLHLRISATWPWRHELTAAFHRLTALPRPAG